MGGLATAVRGRRAVR